MLDDAAKQFRRLQNILERIVPKKRQKELGIGYAKPGPLEHRYVLPANTPFPPDRGRRNLLQRGVWCFRVDSPRSWVHNGLTCEKNSRGQSTLGTCAPSASGNHRRTGRPLSARG